MMLQNKSLSVCFVFCKSLVKKTLSLSRSHFSRAHILGSQAYLVTVCKTLGHVNNYILVALDLVVFLVQQTPFKIKVLLVQNNKTILSISSLKNF